MNRKKGTFLSSNFFAVISSFHTSLNERGWVTGEEYIKIFFAHRILYYQLLQTVNKKRQRQTVVNKKQLLNLAFPRKSVIAWIFFSFF